MHGCLRWAAPLDDCVHLFDPINPISTLPVLKNCVCSDEWRIMLTRGLISTVSVCVDV